MIHNDQHGQKVRLTMDTQTTIEKTKKTSNYFRALLIIAGSTPMERAKQILGGTNGFTKNGTPKNAKAWLGFADQIKEQCKDIEMIKEELKTDVESGDYSHIHISVDGASQDLTRLYNKIVLNKSLTRAQTIKALKNS
tara:strand:+ start:121 stop:534 length:414 start_codon:yes stop_codon:yes gene_type:complete